MQASGIVAGYTRWEHGGKPVFVRGEGKDRVYILGENATVEFSSSRKLLNHLYGRETRIPWSRYLHPSKTEGETIYDVLQRREHIYGIEYLEIHVPGRSAKTPPVVSSLLRGLEEVEREALKHEALIQPFLAGLEHVEAIIQAREAEAVAWGEFLHQLTSPVLGIDLAKRGIEVRKLLFAGFSSLMRAGGYDPEEVLQEVYKGLEVRNRGKCPWDPRKSTFGHYVHMVCSGILRNYHRKVSNRRRRYIATDVGGDDHNSPSCSIFEATDESSIMALRRFYGWLCERPCHSENVAKSYPLILPLLIQGYTRDEMVAETGLSKGIIAKTIRWVRDQAQIWSA